jgi:carboxypeptidase family protein
VGLGHGVDGPHTVTDPSGAVTPNGKVTVENSEKGLVREPTTNFVGAYALAPVRVGDYTVTVEATGFQKGIRTGIALRVGQIQRIDMTLKVGSQRKNSAWSKTYRACKPRRGRRNTTTSFC